MDNLSSHCNDAFVELVAKLSNVACPTLKNGQTRREWLQSTDKRIVIHFTPFHGSWLNRIEIWFGILNQKCLNESYDCYKSMIAAIYEFVDIWNTLLAHPFKFSYDGTGLHQKAVRRFMRILENQCQAWQRILKKHDLKPHQSKYFLHISDPDFFPKLDHLLELFANPPERLWFFDECPGIQILTRIAPDMSTEDKQRWLREFEYNRNGTLDVMAFLEAKTGKVSAKCTFNHKSETFNEVFEGHVSDQPENARLDYVMDNLSSHCNDAFVELVAKLSNVACPTLKNGQTRREWLQSTDKRIVIHFTPFHGSWLNRIEIWFGILNQKCLNESYDCYKSMIAAIYEFVDIWNTLLAHPFKFSYDGTGLHQKAVRRFMRILENQCRGPLPIKFLVKQLLIMTNLINTYSKKVDFKVWVQLDELLRSRKAHLKELIEFDEKPKRKQKAHEALEKLLTTSSDYLKVYRTSSGLSER